MARGRPAISLVGQRFGFLTVLERAGSETWCGEKKYATWLCRCDCDQQVAVRGQKLRKGLFKACNINGHRFHKKFPRRHHLSEYRTWGHMWERCTSRRASGYKNYGKRGIKVCARWKSFEAFMEDMGPKPAGFTIERKDTNGNYEPANCRWASDAEQRRNKRNSVFVIYEGKRMLLLDVVAALGLDRQRVYERLKMGWSLNEAISTPVKKYKTKIPPCQP